VIESNKDTVKLVFKNYPLPNHRYSRKAAAAALAADTNGKYWEFHEALFKNMRKLSDKKVREIATSLGLDADEIEKEMNSKKIQKMISQDIKDANEAGIRGTPTIFINGIQLKNPSLQGFQDLINSRLKKRP
jgi:protein-disulfide isomerase